MSHRQSLPRLAASALLASAVLVTSAPSAHAQAVQPNDSGVHGEDQGVSPGSAHHHRAGRSPARLRHRPDAAQVPRQDRRHAGRADLRQGHPSLLRRARQVVAAREGLAHGQERGRPRHDRRRRRRRSDDQGSRQVQGHAQAAHRPAEDHRRAGARGDQDGEADLLAHERHALAGDRRPRDADGARVPPRRRGDAVHPEHPQQRHHAHHAGDRGGRPREAGGHLLLQQEARAGRRAPAADVLGQVRAARQQPRRHGPVPRAHEGDDEDLPRVDADRAARSARGAVVSLPRAPARARTTSSSIPSRSTSGG